MSALPQKSCPHCPRLVAFRKKQRQQHPDWFNAPVPCFGKPTAALLVLGLAPGLKGANRTGRVFTGDGAGNLLFPTMIKFGFAEGNYQAHAKDGLKLQKAMISNVVRCVPPQNAPKGEEIKNCQRYLDARLRSMPNLKVVVALGHVAHKSLLTSLGVRKSLYPFKHGEVHKMENFLLLDSYHCSRYNISTKRLTQKMFDSIFQKAQKLLSDG